MKTQVKPPVKHPAASQSPAKNQRPTTTKYQAPKGFDIVSTGGNGVMVDWDKQAVIEGIVVDIQPITLKPEKKGAKPKTTRILTLDTKNGHMGIWEKVQLKTLFDSVEKGSSVWIAHLGTKKIPGRPLPMHEFSVAMK